jgi:hypothetical protein
MKIQAWLESSESSEIRLLESNNKQIQENEDKLKVSMLSFYLSALCSGKAS